MTVANLDTKAEQMPESEKNPRANIFILSGPSGVGKRTVRERLDMEDLNMENSVSWTTRAPRAEDEEGVTYHFATPEEFEAAVARDEFAEHAGFADHAYGTPRSQIEGRIAKGINVMLEIEVNGAEQVMEKYPEVVSIFLVPPTLEELESRLKNRGTESEDAVNARLARARVEMDMRTKYQHVVVNDDAQRAADEVAAIIKECAE